MEHGHNKLGRVYPAGRTSFFDNDPAREKYGITRECERILRRRGISIYPCLIPSMQKLTERGAGLARRLREKKMTVIESYPGAAQDILCIPRKSAGLKYLAEGLIEFGLKLDLKNGQITHDELDAATSALVGMFYQAGMFEALGCPEEGCLIVPELTH